MTTLPEPKFNVGDVVRYVEQNTHAACGPRIIRQVRRRADGRPWYDLSDMDKVSCAGHIEEQFLVLHDQGRIDAPVSRSAFAVGDKAKFVDSQITQETVTICGFIYDRSNGSGGSSRGAAILRPLTEKEVEADKAAAIKKKDEEIQQTIDKLNILNTERKALTGDK